MSANNCGSLVWALYSAPEQYAIRAIYAISDPCLEVSKFAGLRVTACE